MSGNRQADNNVKAGIFVLCAVVTGVVVIFILGDVWGRLVGPPTTSYRVTFTVADGVGFLSSGSEVRLGGVLTGQVEAVDFVDSEDPLREIEVTFSIPADVSLYSNAVAVIQNGLISADSAISLSSVGWDDAHRDATDMGEPGTLLAAGDVFRGTPSGGMLASLLGPDAGAALSGSLERIEEITGRLREEGYVLEWILGAEEAKSVQAGADTLGHVFQKMGGDGYVIEWALGDTSAAQVRGALSDAEQFMARLRLDWVGPDGQTGWSAEVDKFMTKSDDLALIVTDVKALINDNRKKIQGVIDDLSTTLADAKVTMADLRANAPLWSADIGTTLANLSLASQQVDMLLVEVRNAPWKLLYQPSKEEVTGELLYESSRNFVFGAADLKSAAESMDRLIESRGHELDESAADFRLVRENLTDAVRRYERAQQQLSQILHGDSVPPSQ
ncbi:MAG: MlaD family protein [Phycisphaerales bacterium]|nr:MlaD family protein [Phycisphaerales bacterium]